MHTLANISGTLIENKERRDEEYGDRKLDDCDLIWMRVDGKGMARMAGG